MLRRILEAVSHQRGPAELLGLGNAEESRAYLQARLTALFKGMFWSFTTLLLFLWVLYEVYPDIRPALNRWVFVVFTIGLVSMAVLWRGLLVRRTLSRAALQALDLVYTTGCGVAIALCALIVPSSGPRTALASALGFAPMTAGAIVLALTTDQEVPGPMFFLGYAMVAVVAVLLSAGGSRIIYDLSRKATAAQQLGQYKLVRKIGEGGMGTVHLAHHVLLRRPTAIKLLPPDKVGGANNLERFVREVQHMSQLSHPNTVAVFDYGHSPDGVFYYAMEYLGGGVDLEHLVAAYGPQPAARVAQILAQVCGALQEAHDAKLIHRDIKPANIILCERGGMPDVAKVVDFGLVKEITGDTGASTQIILGTPAYIAPEAVTDPSTIGPAVDLYALGCVGYFLLTGKRVFEGKTAVEVCIQHATAVPKPPSACAPVSPDLDAIILRCLAKRPDERYPSAAALAGALRALPPTPDWDRAEARRWWRDFAVKEQAAAAASSSPTLTITVDLGHRDVRSA